jgi:hypothetical protein
MEAKNRIALLPRQTVIRNLAALRPRRSWSANRAYRRALVLRLHCGVRHVQSQSENGVRMGSEWGRSSLLTQPGTHRLPRRQSGVSRPGNPEP